MSLGGWQGILGKGKEFCFILCARKIIGGDMIRFVFLKELLGCHVEDGLKRERT